MKITPLLVLATLFPLLLTFSCAPSIHSARIAAQDFRFVPAMIEADTSRPLRLVIVNEGREPHEFATPLFSDPRVRFLSEPYPAASPGGFRILPGQSVEVTLLPPPGTYLFRCLIRGHAGMQGTIVITA